MKPGVRRKLKQRSGQAAIEFIAIVVVIFFFLLFFMSLAFTLVVSQYLDYATFMAARTYKTGLSTQSIQETRAREIFLSYAQRIQGLARNFRFEIVDAEPNRNQSSGVKTSYDLNLFYLPPVFITGDGQPVSNITLTSEAHLGRDPAIQDCYDYFNQFTNRFGLGLDGSSLLSQMEDNGC